VTTEPSEQRSTFVVGGPDVIWRETDDQIVVLDLRSAAYFGLNGSAGVLWRRLAAGARQADLTEALMAGAPVGKERARSDVEAFLDDLRHHGLLQERRLPTP
jgi:hypothetical protein